MIRLGMIGLRRALLRQVRGPNHKMLSRDQVLEEPGLNPDGL